jgi:hypothetical protein
VDFHECHFRWSLAWQASQISLKVLARNFADLEIGATLQASAAAEKRTSNTYAKVGHFWWLAQAEPHEGWITKIG